MKNIILISKTNIINQIFKLVLKKLSIDMSIIDDDNLLYSTDIIFIDDEFKDNDIIKYKTFCKRLVLITKEENISNSFDLTLKKPFLPSQLQSFLLNIIRDKDINESIKIDESISINEKNKDKIQDESIDDLVSFIEDMSDENISNIEDEYSESIYDETTVTKEELGDGGVLDKEELSKLFDLMNDDTNENKFESNLNDEDWIDLGDIIDKAIDDVSEYEFDTNKPIKLMLNKYSMQELSPLFKKLDQNIIDNLIDGTEITLQLRLEK